MNERQIEFLRALLNRAGERDRGMPTFEWIGDEEFENWTRADTIELDKVLEGMSK